MKNVTVIAFIFTFMSLHMLTLNGAEAAVKAGPKKTISSKKIKKPVKKMGTQAVTDLSTDINFEGSVVRGKYQVADEAVATVENEKTLDDLLGLRREFKDRLELEEMRK